jgi:aryl-alcohol dehydrogenase-like predicted oxidoreductase
MRTRKLGPFSVAEIGLGCMNLSHAYDVPPASEAAERVLVEALERGVTLFDTAALYGFGENERLVGRVLRARRHEIVLATKGGMAGVEVDGAMKRVIDGRPEAIRKNCEASLERLGTGVIDLYYLHRVDLGNQVPVEDSVGEMARLVEEGKVRALGISEVSAATLRRAHAVHPIAALESEYSLWTRNPELGTLEVCRDLGIGFVAFSPLGRGYLTGTLRDVAAFVDKDIRRRMPRFLAENYAKNLELLAGLRALARETGKTLSELALAWLLGRGEHVIPIPGTTSVAHLAEDLRAADLALTSKQMARLDAALDHRRVAGARYGADTLPEIDTEAFGSS